MSTKKKIFLHTSSAINHQLGLDYSWIFAVRIRILTRNSYKNECFCTINHLITCRISLDWILLIKSSKFVVPTVTKTCDNAILKEMFCFDLFIFFHKIPRLYTANGELLASPKCSAYSILQSHSKFLSHRVSPTPRPVKDCSFTFTI